MTIPYNVSLRSASERLLTKFNYNPETQKYCPENDENVSLTYKELHTVCSAVYKAFFKMHPALKNVVDYFKAMADLMTACNCPIT